MASISRDKNGNRTIQFVDSGRRRGIWLGRTQQRTAETIKCHVEELLTARNEGRSPYNETSAWVGRIGDELYAKLARVGLLPKRAGARTIYTGGIRGRLHR